MRRLRVLVEIPAAVRAQYRHVLGWQAAVLGVASRAWAEVSSNAISESWSTQVPYLAQSFDALRRNVAVDSAIYTPLALAEQGQYRVGDAFTDVDAFLFADALDCQCQMDDKPDESLPGQPGFQFFFGLTDQYFQLMDDFFIYQIQQVAGCLIDGFIF